MELMNQNGRIPCCLGRWRSIWAASRIPWSETGSCSAPTPCVSVSSAPWARPTASPSSLWADSASFHPSGAPSSSSLTRRPRWRPTSGRASRPATPTKTTACRRDPELSTRPFCVSRSNPTPEIMQGTMPGARRRGRPCTAWMDNIKTWTGLSVEESIKMTEDRDKWRKYVHGVANPRIEDG